MMVHEKEGPFGLALLHFRGTALKQIWPAVIVVTLASVLVEIGYDYMGLDEAFTLTTIPFSLIGLALSIFLGFRNNACYDRYWEGRKLWGRMVNNSRTLTRIVFTLVEQKGDGLRRELLLRQAAYVHALRMHLRDDHDWHELEAFIPKEEVEALYDEPNVPNAILFGMAGMVRKAWKDGRIETYHVPTVEACLTENSDVQGGCERIKGTPLPMSYTVLTHRIVGLYVFALPFGLHTEIGYVTPIVVALIAYAFLGLDAIGSEIEDPFDKDDNDLPLSFISRNIEREIFKRLGKPMAEIIRPEDGFLR